MSGEGANIVWHDKNYSGFSGLASMDEFLWWVDLDCLNNGDPGACSGAAEGFAFCRQVRLEGTNHSSYSNFRYTVFLTVLSGPLLAPGRCSFRKRKLSAARPPAGGL